MVVFLAKGGRVSMPRGEDDEMTVPALPGLDALEEMAFLESWRQRSFGGDTWLPVLLCACDDNVVLSLQS